MSLCGGQSVEEFAPGDLYGTRGPAPPRIGARTRPPTRRRPPGTGLRSPCPQGGGPFLPAILWRASGPGIPRLLFPAVRLSRPTRERLPSKQQNVSNQTQGDAVLPADTAAP